MMTCHTILFCEELPHHSGGTYLAHFFSHPKSVQMCRDQKSWDEIPILETEVSQGTDTPESYWGWWDDNRKRWELVFPRKFLVEMCFPYGTDPEELVGRGKLLPVNIKILRRVKPE